MMYTILKLLACLHRWNTGVNRELFEKVADYIEQNPEQYDQRDSRKCIFGIAAKLSNADPTWFVGCNDRGRYYDFVRDGRQQSVAYHLFKFPNPGEASVLVLGLWEPRKGLTVPQALRLIARGCTVYQVSKR